MLVDSKITIFWSCLWVEVGMFRFHQSPTVKDEVSDSVLVFAKITAKSLLLHLQRPSHTNTYM